jgi:hypothetical protein
MKNNKWSDLGIKDKLAIGSACVAFALGWIITGLAAFVPLLISEQGVLWILGQSLVYTASVFGVSLYFKSEAIQLRHDIDKHLEHVERMRLKEKMIDKMPPSDYNDKLEEEEDE